MQRIKVKITNDPSGSWYENQLGREFWVYKWGTSYVLTADYDHGYENMWRHIEKDDCIIMDESPSPSLPETEQYPPITSNVPDQTGIARQWLEIWSEVENWYGDPKKRESGAQLLLRLQSSYSLADRNSPPPDQPVPEEVMEWLNAEIHSELPYYYDDDAVAMKVDAQRAVAKKFALFMYKRDQAVIAALQKEAQNWTQENFDNVHQANLTIVDLQSRLSSTEAQRDEALHDIAVYKEWKDRAAEERDAIRKAFDEQEEELKKLQNGTV